MNFTEAIVLAVEKVKAWIQSGGVKWDHVFDKPFVKVGGDTLTWDGNTEGLESFSIMNPMYKVSDVVLTAADLVNGFSAILRNSLGEEQTFSQNDVAVAEEDNALFFVSGTDYFLCSADHATLAAVGFDLPSGTYFGVTGSDGKYISSLTIPGYTGFAKEQIDPKVLPEALQFGEVYGDTMTWTAITDEADLDLSLIVGEMLYPVSDAKITMDDLSKGIIFDCAPLGINNVTITVEEIIEVSDGCILIAELFFVVGKDNTTVSDDGATFVFPKAGMYVPLDFLFANFSLTINGFDGFLGVQKMDERLIPANIVRKTDLVQPDWKQTDETAMNFIKNKPSLEYKTLVSVLDNNVRYVSQNGSEKLTYEQMQEIIREYGIKITIQGSQLLSNGYYTKDGVPYWVGYICMSNGEMSPCYTAEYTA